MRDSCISDMIIHARIVAEEEDDWMDKQMKLPVGIDSFSKIRKNGFYYVDKTRLIEQLVENWGEVNLFTRPRRFGKTLNMSMLQSFFEIGTDPSLFHDLYISHNKSVCEKYMGKYPVIFLSLKNVEGLSYESARYQLVELIGKEARRFQFLIESSKLDACDKESYQSLIQMKNGKYDMDDSMLLSSLQLLSELLSRHFEQKTILLIDEYDVPLDKAFQHGYYREMITLIRTLFGKALKTNDSLEFAVLTGCLRVSKESIFTGLNNFRILSITDSRFDEQFGFTDREVRELLAYYHLEDRFQETKEWYDGYHFGNADVYCPWDVINHVDRIRIDSSAAPEAYWINTSDNDLVRRFISKAGRTTRDEIEKLIEGETIVKHIRLDLTYDEIDSSIDNLWSVLFTTGYLTQSGRDSDGAWHLLIPNREIREVFRLQIQEWFRQSVLSNTEQLQNFWNDLIHGNSKKTENYLNRILSNSFSVFDAQGKNEEKEISYHNLLVGMLSGNGDWLVKSNTEAGNGFADIIIETDDPNAGIVIELKYTRDMCNLAESCTKALKQIHDRRYQDYLLNEGRHDILLYGISFCRKRCMVQCERL